MQVNSTTKYEFLQGRNISCCNGKETQSVQIGKSAGLAAQGRVAPFGKLAARLVLEVMVQVFNGQLIILTSVDGK